MDPSTGDASISVEPAPLAAAAGPTPSHSGRSADWYLYVFKVRPCYRTYPHNWSNCPYHHTGEKARRRDPRVFNYRPLPCPHDRKHNVYEFWLHPMRFRTTMCQDAAACTRPLCFFAHTPEELRRPELPEEQQGDSTTQALGQGSPGALTGGQGSPAPVAAAAAGSWAAGQADSSGAGVPAPAAVHDIPALLAGQSCSGSGVVPATAELTRQAEQQQADLLSVLTNSRQRHAAAAAAVAAAAAGAPPGYDPPRPCTAPPAAGAAALNAAGSFICNLSTAAGQYMPVLSGSPDIGIPAMQLGPDAASLTDPAGTLAWPGSRYSYSPQAPLSQQQQDWASTPLVSPSYTILHSLDSNLQQGWAPAQSSMQGQLQQGMQQLPQQAAVNTWSTRALAPGPSTQDQLQLQQLNQLQLQQLNQLQLQQLNQLQLQQQQRLVQQQLQAQPIPMSVAAVNSGVLVPPAVKPAPQQQQLLQQPLVLLQQPPVLLPHGQQQVYVPVRQQQQGSGAAPQVVQILQPLLPHQQQLQAASLGRMGSQAMPLPTTNWARVGGYASAIPGPQLMISSPSAGVSVPAGLPGPGQIMLSSAGMHSLQLPPAYPASDAFQADGSRSLPIFQLSAPLLPGQDPAAGASAGGGGGPSVEALQAVLHQLSMYEDQVQDL